MGTLVQKLRARLVDERWIEVLAAEPLARPPEVPAYLTMLKVTATDAMGKDLVVQAMVDAGEDVAIAPRFALGDTLYAWMDCGVIACFGWSTERCRTIAALACREAPERVYLYNFHTLPAWRGRGLYASLLSQMRYDLGKAGKTELVIDVRSDNHASLKGILNAGFAPVARVAYRKVLGRWDVHSALESVAGASIPPERLFVLPGTARD